MNYQRRTMRKPRTKPVDAASALKTFIEDNGVSRDDAAEALGTTRTALYYWLTQKTVPSEKSKIDIATWTRGAVAVSAWPVNDRRKPDPAHHVKPFSPRPTGTE